MPRNMRVWLVLLLVLILTPSSVWAQEGRSVDELIVKATAALQEVAEQPDAHHMVGLLEHARGLAIFPSVVKAGLFLGGQYGKGMLLERDPRSGQWYGPSFLDIKGVSYGWQVGIQNIALVLVIANERGLANFQRGDFKLGGDLAIAAGPVGRRAELGTDSKLEASIYSYSMTRGAFLGMSVEGARISIDRQANQDYWEEDYATDDIFAQRAIRGPILPLIKTINDLLGILGT